MDTVRTPPKNATIHVLYGGVKEVAWFETVDGVKYYVQQIHEPGKVTEIKNVFKMPPFVC